MVKIPAQPQDGNTHILLEPKRRENASHCKAVAKSPENARQGRGYSNESKRPGPVRSPAAVNYFQFAL